MLKKNFETVLVFTPVLSDADQRKAVKDYVDFLKEQGAEILEEDFWGMRQLAYPIKKKTTGIYFVTEYITTGEIVDLLEVKCKRDTGILRFLTVRLDKFSMEYNEKKRQGLVGKNRKKTPEEKEKEAARKAADEAKKEAKNGNNRGKRNDSNKPKPKAS